MKFQKQSVRKIDISQITITENVRKQYDDIESLARSIERDGQLQPIGVVEKENGTFDMLYGFRRLNAHMLLVKEGKDFHQIEAKITNGDPVAIQLIENIHRKNLKPEEFENALDELEKSGMTRTEIASRLNISLSSVSDSLAAKATRDRVKSEGADTSGISTSAMSLMRSVPKGKEKETVERVKRKGGTVKAVREEMELIDEVAPKLEALKNPEHCTKEVICKNHDKCNICSYNSIIITDKIGKWQMTVQEFLLLPEVVEIINRKNIEIKNA
jgi:ParB/RepB/Spo0J family partition protein